MSIDKKSSLESFRPLAILLESFTFFKKNMNLFLKITLIITIPSAFLLGSQDSSLNTDYTAFTSIASVFLFLALVWIYFNLNKAKKLKISDIYKKISSYFLQALMATILLTIIAAPLVLVIFISILLVTAIPQYWYIYIVPALLAAFFASLLVAKYSLGFIIIIKEGLTSFKSIARSGKLLKKNVLRIFFGYFIFFLAVIVINVLIIYLLSLNQVLAQNSLLLSISNSILVSIYLPILIIYMCKSYEVLTSEVA